VSTVALTSDLIFSAKIREVAAAVGAEVLITKTVEKVPNETTYVLFDLESRSFPAIETLKALKLKLPNARVIGFFSHVHCDIAESALAHGANEVMPRSRFVKVLPDLLRS